MYIVTNYVYDFSNLFVCVLRQPNTTEAERYNTCLHLSYNYIL